MITIEADKLNITDCRYDGVPLSELPLSVIGPLMRKCQDDYGFRINGLLNEIFRRAVCADCGQTGDCDHFTITDGEGDAAVIFSRD